MFSLTNILIAVGSLLAYFLYRQKKKYDFWKERNVPHVGFKRDLLFNGKKHRSLNLQDIYDEFSSHRYMGFYQGGKPHLLIRDLDLIRNVLVKDFAHFTDHVKMFNTDNDPLIRENIFSLDGERWKNVRTRLTPIFSSGKLRRMSSLMDECAKILDRHLDLTLAKSDEIEVRELMQKFSMDVMGICAFGLNCNAVIDEQSAFRRVAKKLFSPGSMSKFMLMMVAGCISPRIVSWLKVKLIDQEVDDFFYSIMRDTLKNREETAMKRDDFVQLLMNLRAEEKKMIESGNYDSEPLFNDDICAANVFVFYAAGLDAFSATMSFCLYDLALHPDIQERLYKEIVQVQKANEGQVTYDVLQKMEYMDCVISETLRVHTSSGTLERVCTKKYQIPGSPLVIDEDMIVTIPGQSIHMDPKYFPNPEKYDPERFNEENKAKIIPGSYFPFSDGPRICIGMRFAIVEMKAALSRIIESYSVHPSPKTEIPIIPNPRSLSSSPATLYLRFQKR